MATPTRRPAPVFGRLRRGLASAGLLARGSDEAPTDAASPGVLTRIGRRFENGREPRFPHRPRAGGKRLRLLLDRGLARYRDGAGAAVFELVARSLAGDKAGALLGSALSDAERPVLLVLLDRSRHLVEVDRTGSVVGLNRAVLRPDRLSPTGCLAAVGITNGLRAAALLRAGQRVDAEKERLRDVQNLLLLLVGVRGTEWRATEVRAEFGELLDPAEPLLDTFTEYATKLSGKIRRKRMVRLDDRVFRDGALFDRLPGREKLRVVFAGTLAWYGLLTLGLLRLPRKWFARRNPYYETAWWIFRSKPGGRRLFKGALARRAMERLRSFRLLSAVEYLWSAWNPTLAVTCLRPVYRSAGGNHRPFLATMATFAYTALVIHPLWVTLTITGAAWALGHVWPWIFTHTRIASRENLILHAIVIGFWIGVGLVVATSKLLRRLLSGRRSSTSPAPPR
jgi:hypothetical protein